MKKYKLIIATIVIIAVICLETFAFGPVIELSDKWPLGIFAFLTLICVYKKKDLIHVLMLNCYVHGAFLVFIGIPALIFRWFAIFLIGNPMELFVLGGMATSALFGLILFNYAENLHKHLYGKKVFADEKEEKTVATV